MRAPLHALAASLLLAGFAPAATAQSTCAPGTATDTLAANNVRALLLNNGGLFWKGAGNVYNVPVAPRGQPITPNALFASNLWVGGRVDGEVHTAATNYSNWEFIPGPLDGQGGPPADCAAHDRIFRITADDLDQLARGTVTDAVREWPWAWGAPVIDGDGVSGNYNLAGGDRPELLGSEAHWWVMNAMGAHPRTGSAPFPLEVQATAFAVSSTEAALDDATLYRFRFVWRGPGTFTDAFVGLWTDSDLGNASDDYVGADSALSMVYAYNADNFDEGSDGYGLNPPAVGTAVVQAPRVGAREGAYAAQWHPKNNALWGSENGTFTPQSYLNRLLGLSTEGAPHPRCGDSISPSYLSCGTTRFTFTGFPETGTGWSMRTPVPLATPLAPSDQRMLLSAGPFTFQRDEGQDVVFAVTWARGSDHLNSVARLRAATQRVRDVWRATGYRGLPVLLVAPPAAPRPVTPSAGATGQPSPLTFGWEPVETASHYTLELSTAAGVQASVITEQTGATVELPAGIVAAGQALTWRVRAGNRAGEGPWSTPLSLTLGGGVLGSTRAGFRAFLATHNAAGPLNPPEFGAMDPNHRGFPRVGVPTDDATPGRIQSTNNAVWGLHTADTDASDGGFAYFVARTTRDGALLPHLSAGSYEMRFTGTSVGYNAFGDRAVYPVPFELWDVGRDAGAGDDVRMVPFIEPVAGGVPDVFDIGADHPTSGGTNDPQTDGVYWMRPRDASPGQAGYLAVVARIQANPQGYDAGDVTEVMARTVLVSFNGGPQFTGPFNARLPEAGTVFRIETAAAATSAPVPAAPADGAVTSGAPVLYWHEPAGTDRRWVEVARDAAFTDLVVRDTATAAGTYTVTAPLVAGQTYYWRARVHANGAFGAESAWSATARFTAGASTGIASGEGVPAVLVLDTPRPHPVGGTATVRLGVPVGGPLRVRLYDLLGRARAVLFEGVAAPGYTVLPLDAAALAPGLYVLQAEHGGRVATRAVVVAR